MYTQQRQGRRVTIIAFSALTLLSATILFAACAEMFQPKIPKPDGTERGSVDTLFKQEEEFTQLAVPSQLYAAPFYSRSEVRLSWESVHNAAYYLIERAVAIPVQTDFGLEWETPDDGDYETLERFVYGISYTDEILKNPSLDSPEYQYRYYYRVSAFNPAQKLDESDPCEPRYAMLFRAPASIRASGGVSTDYIEVRWERTEDAVSYEVWRSDTERGVPASLGNVSANQNYFTNFIDTRDQGKNYYYVVTAKNSFGNISLQTKSAMGFAKMEGAPEAPVIRRSPGYGRGNSNNGTRIEWDKVEDAAYYTVYRFSSNDSSLTRLVPEIVQTSWTDSAGLKPGVYYYYRVQAFGKDAADTDLPSPFSGPDLGDKKLNELNANERDRLAESFIISPPDTVAAEKEAGGAITIKWLPPIGADTERREYFYVVYADNRIDGDFANAATPTGVGSATDSDGYIYARGVSLEQGSFFKVVTFNGGAESIPSIVVAPSPAPAVIREATQYAFISPEAVANPNGVYPVRITWVKPANEDPAFYRVERSTRPDGGFAKINDTSLRADGTGGGAGYFLDGGVYSFIDRNDTARVGRKYYYRVLSLNQLEGGSFYSEVKTGWGALTYTQYILEYNKTMKSALKKLTYMHKPGSTEKLGTETKYGTISGQIYYNGQISGLGARIIIKLTDYAEFYIENDSANGVYFILNGDSNTSANMSSNGTMDGTMNCTGMYPGWVKYDGIEIKGGAAGGGTYEVQPAGFSATRLSYTILN